MENENKSIPDNQETVNNCNKSMIISICCQLYHKLGSASTRKQYSLGEELLLIKPRPLPPIENNSLYMIDPDSTTYPEPYSFTIIFKNN